MVTTGYACKISFTRLSKLNFETSAYMIENSGEICVKILPLVISRKQPTTISKKQLYAPPLPHTQQGNSYMVIHPVVI